MNHESNQNQMIFVWFMSRIESVYWKVAWIMNWIESIHSKSFDSWHESIQFFESHYESIQKKKIESVASGSLRTSHVELHASYSSVNFTCRATCQLQLCNWQYLWLEIFVWDKCVDIGHMLPKCFAAVHGLGSAVVLKNTLFWNFSWPWLHM